MTPQELTEIRNKRLLDSFNLQPVDRIPIDMGGQGFFKFIDPKAVLADYFRRPHYVDDLLIEAAKLPILSEIDQAPQFGMVSEGGMEMFASLLFARIKLPGRDLPDDTLWNMDEQGPMTEEDYDLVIDKGWDYVTKLLFDRIGFDPAKVPPPDMAYFGELRQRAAVLGKATVEPTAMLPFPPFETLSGARKLQRFIRDLRRFPDKVRAALDVVEDHAVETSIKMLKAGPPAKLCVIGGTRAGSSFISPATFEKFYLPYYHKIVPRLVDMGIKVRLHMDNDWSGFLHYFKEFPKASLIWDPDQLTPMAKIKEELGGYHCIMGNIPSALLSVGTPEQCYESAKEMLELMSDTPGFIMSPGCSVPMDGKRENIEAVILATLGEKLPA